MAMNPRLLRPTQNTHPEAADWANRVRDNGGSVSGSTLLAVSRFCRAIDAAGIRSKFYRLGIFAGDNLNAAMVPLYRSASVGGAVLGYPTDTNQGPFIPGDYSQSVGLNANGIAGNSNKYLETGLSPNDFPSGSGVGHASVFHGAGSVGVATQSLIGSRTATAFWYLRKNGNTDIYNGNIGFGVFVASASADTDAGLALHTRDAAGYAIYKNTNVIATDAARTPGANANDYTVFNHRATDGTVSSGTGWIHAISSYSIGDSLSSSQVTSYYNALTAFNTAMGR